MPFSISNFIVVRIKLFIAFWIFGICNNYPYVIMLSAANDIMTRLEKNSFVDPNMGNQTLGNQKVHLNCTKHGTGPILLADIVPTFIFKLIAPLFIQNIKIPHKISFVVIAAVISFIIVGFAQSIWLTIVGVVLASLSSGVGEVTFLALTAFYDKQAISFWSSGTGGAGVVGALSYAGLTSVISPQNTLFTVAAFPLLMMIAYIFLLKKPENRSFYWYDSCNYKTLVNDEDTFFASDPPSITSDQDQIVPNFQEKLNWIMRFLFLTVPLAFVYLFEYIINQGLFDLLYFPGTFLEKPAQYRWYQVIYQIGVFISRSSLSLVKIKRTWILTILQGLNVALFIFQIAYRFIPSIWVVFVLILYEGLLGGGAYVNTFYYVLRYSDPSLKEFNMGAASFWDSLGIFLAGILAIPIHNNLCNAFSL